MARFDLLEVLDRTRRLLGFVVGGFLSSLKQNAGMGFLALALSTSIWIFITNEQNPPRTGVLPTRIPVHPVNVPADLDILGQPDSVVVRVTAPSDLWDGLTENSFEANVDLTGLQQGDSDVAVHVRAKDGRVRVLDVVPSRVTIRLDVLRRQVVPVRVNLQQSPPLGFATKGDPQITPNQVTVLGAEGLVSLVDVAIADVNLSSVRSNLSQSFPLVPRTARGYDITGVRFEPASAVIGITVEQQINHVSLPVVAQVQGSPQPGFSVTRVQVDPLTVLAVARQDVLQTVTVLKTLPVDVSNAGAPFSRTVGLDVPQGVALVDRNSVQLTVSVEPVSGTAVFQVAPQFLGVSTELVADSPTSSVEVTVEGRGPALKDLTASRISVLLNLEGKDPGTYAIDPEVRLPQGFSLIRISPSRMTVNIHR